MGKDKENALNDPHTVYDDDDGDSAPSEATNPFLGRRYRILAPTLTRLINRKWPNATTDVEQALKLDIARDTLTKMKCPTEDDVSQGAAVEKVAKKLGVPVYVFAEIVDGGSFTDAFLIGNKVATEFSRWKVAALVMKGMRALDNVNSLWHWSRGTVDPERQHREIFGKDKSKIGFAVFEVTFDGDFLDAVVSYEIAVGGASKAHAMATFGVMIDYGRLFRRADEQRVWSMEPWIRRVVQKNCAPPAANTVQFATWIDKLVGNFMLRSSTAFTIKEVAFMGGDEGDGRIDDPKDFLVGFKRWATHQSPEDLRTIATKHRG
jgi:hypothetical protein